MLASNNDPRVERGCSYMANLVSRVLGADGRQGADAEVGAALWSPAVGAVGGPGDPGGVVGMASEPPALGGIAPSWDGLLASVLAAPLVLEETAVEAECRRMPAASGPGKIVSNKIPAEVQPWIIGARQMKTRFAAHFGAPREADAASSTAQMGVGVHGGAEMFIHSMVGARSAGGFSRMFEWIRSAEGTQQGDPLGPFFMAAPLQPAVLREILRAHREVYIIAYLDDIHILGEPEQVREAYDTAVPLLAGIGLELNGTDAGGHPLVAALVSAMEDVCGACEGEGAGGEGGRTCAAGGAQGPGGGAKMEEFR
ncbi:hypothetical protein CYMTET_6130 [Cymbomonas tetramitiformis]|uniref:Reverse transcriptase domain-containing protein n=1 Tax=Cymbomonas tetramitiformis TaxID=36881 RepID=A0AAE0LIT3_9CHLO|nr:hypothetical protein CYMTET_6130 [Cymbomonas tetramitiformis]